MFHRAANNRITISDSTLSSNVSEVGGAFYAQGTGTLSNCTFSGNTATAGSGGAVLNGASLTISNCTVSGNTAAGWGGGLANSEYFSTLTLLNAIVAGNSATSYPDIGAAVTITSANNLIGNGTGMTGITNGSNGNQVGTSGSPINPDLGTLQNNGGPTDTMALSSTSPAIGAGTTPAASTDQRGYGWNTDDIGAYAYDGVPPPAVSAVSPAGGPTSGGTTVTITGTTFTGATAVDLARRRRQVTRSTPRRRSRQSLRQNQPARWTSPLARPSARHPLPVATNSSTSCLTTTTTLTSSVNPSTYGQSVTFTATVAPTSGGGTPTGTVEFYDGGTSMGSGTLSVVGSYDEAAFSTSALPAGSDTITADYEGDTTFVTSTSSGLDQTVTQFTATGSAFVALQNNAFSGTVGTFTFLAGTTYTDYTAEILWGDGQESTATISSSGGYVAQVSGSHTYYASGNYAVAFQVKDTVHNTTLVGISEGLVEDLDDDSQLQSVGSDSL